MVPRIEIFAPTASGLEVSVLVAGGAGAGRGAGLEDITHYGTPCGLKVIPALARFPQILGFYRG
jgi:hypothetical protein